MSTVNDEPLTEREEGRKLYEEADKLLNLAERLQEKCEQYERRQGTLVAVNVSMVVIGGISGIYFIVRAIHAEPVDLIDNMWFWAGLLTVCYMSVIQICLIFPQVKLMRQRDRESRSLHGIVDMLRDLEKGIAEKHNLSALERAEFRIRLSRFDIGPG